MRKYSYPCPTDYSRCQCGYSRKQGKVVSNGCRLHPAKVWDEKAEHENDLRYESLLSDEQEHTEQGE